MEQAASTVNTQPASTEQKVETRYPGLHAAMGVNPKSAAAPAEPATPEATATPATPGNPEPAASAAPAGEQQQQSATPAFNIDNLSDEQKNEIIAKWSGGKVKSIEELNPPKQKSREELEAEAEKRKTEAIAWAFETGKATKSDYDSMVAEKALPNRDLALKVFGENLRAEDKSITDEEIQEMFKDVYHEYAEQDNPKLYAQGQREINKLAEAYRKEKFGMLDSIEDEYTGYLESEAQYKSYKAQVKKVVSELPKEFTIPVEHKNVDGSTQQFSYTIPVDSKLIEKLAADYSKSDAFVMRNINTNGNIKPEDIAKEMSHYIKGAMFDTVLAAALKDHGEKVEAATIAIMGNKRNTLQPLPSGAQPTAAQPKKNDYSGLRKAMEAQRR